MTTSDTRTAPAPLPQPADILDIGCGTRKLHGSVGLDLLPLPGVDIVHNLDHMPWPLPDKQFRWVRAMDVLEHVDDFIGCIQQLYRVLKPGGRLTIKMPFAGSVHQHTDPTHRRGATSRTLDYFIPGTGLSKYSYTKPMFRLDAFQYVRETCVPTGFGWLSRAIDKRLIPLIERFHDTYEHNFVGLYPVHSIRFECIRLTDDGDACPALPLG